LGNDKQSSWRIIGSKKLPSKKSYGNLTEEPPLRSKFDIKSGETGFELHIVRNTAIMEVTLYSPAIGMLTIMLPLCNITKPFQNLILFFSLRIFQRLRLVKFTKKIKTLVKNLVDKIE